MSKTEDLDDNTNELIKYEYYAVEVQDAESKKFVCIPHSWIKLRIADENTVLFKYPSEDSSIIKRLVKHKKRYSDDWATFCGEVRFGSDIYRYAKKRVKQLIKQELKYKVTSDNNQSIAQIETENKINLNKDSTEYKNPSNEEPNLETRCIEITDKLNISETCEALSTPEKQLHEIQNTNKVVETDKLLRVGSPKKYKGSPTKEIKIHKIVNMVVNNALSKDCKSDTNRDSSETIDVKSKLNEVKPEQLNKIDKPTIECNWNWFKYCVLELINLQDINKYICIPSSWICFFENGTHNVVFYYPEDPDEIERRIKDYEAVSTDWPKYTSRFKCGADSYDEAINSINKLKDKLRKDIFKINVLKDLLHKEMIKEGTVPSTSKDRSIENEINSTPSINSDTEPVKQRSLEKKYFSNTNTEFTYDNLETICNDFSQNNINLDNDSLFCLPPQNSNSEENDSLDMEALLTPEKPSYKIQQFDKNTSESDKSISTANQSEVPIKSKVIIHKIEYLNVNTTKRDMSLFETNLAASEEETTNTDARRASEKGEPVMLESTPDSSRTPQINPTKYQYCVIELTSEPPKEIGKSKILCIPSLWIRYAEMLEQKLLIVFYYPIKDLESIEKYVKNKECVSYDNSWHLLTANFKYGTDSYDEAVSCVKMLKVKLDKETSEINTLKDSLYEELTNEGTAPSKSRVHSVETVNKHQVTKPIVKNNKEFAAQNSLTERQRFVNLFPNTDTQFNNYGQTKCCENVHNNINLVKKTLPDLSLCNSNKQIVENESLNFDTLESSKTLMTIERPTNRSQQLAMNTNKYDTSIFRDKETVVPTIPRVQIHQIVKLNVDTNQRDVNNLEDICNDSETTLTSSEVEEIEGPDKSDEHEPEIFEPFSKQTEASTSDQLDPRKYQYCVVKLLDLPPKEIGKSILCIPNTWIKFVDISMNQSILFYYPVKDLESIEERVKNKKRVSYDNSWRYFVAEFKYGTDTYNNAQIYIQVLNGEISKETTDSQLFQHLFYGHIINKENKESSSATKVVPNTKNSTNVTENILTHEQKYRNQRSIFDSDLNDHPDLCKPISANASIKTTKNKELYDEATNLKQMVTNHIQELNSHLYDIDILGKSIKKDPLEAVTSFMQNKFNTFDDEFINILEMTYNEFEKQHILSNLLSTGCYNRCVMLRSVIDSIKNIVSNTKTENVKDLIKVPTLKDKKMTEEKKKYEDNMDVIVIEDDNNANVYVKENNNIDPSTNYDLQPKHKKADSRWTLRYPNKMKHLIELLPKSNIYINEYRLGQCISSAKDSVRLALALLPEIFSDKALQECTVLGLKGKHGLDKHAINTMLQYVDMYAKTKGWDPINRDNIQFSIQNKLARLRKILQKRPKNRM